MRCDIPVMTPTDVQLLLRYFSGIDKILAHRFTLGFAPDEEHLTSLLCELLDDRGSELHRLPYTAKQLNDDLKKNNSLLNMSFKLETIQYNKFQERHITQSDIGIIINYTDTIKRDNSFRKGILIQAKKLFPIKNNTYTADSLYKSFDLDQHHRLYSLAESISKLKDPNDGVNYDCAAYLFYNPPLNSLPERDREIVLYEQVHNWYRYYEDEIHFYRHVSVPYFLSHSLDTTFFMEASSIAITIKNMHGIIEHITKEKATKSVNIDLRSIINKAKMHYNVFACFIVFGLLLGRAGCQNPEWLKVVSGIRPSVTQDVPLFRPRYVFTINITAGTVLG